MSLGWQDVYTLACVSFMTKRLREEAYLMATAYNNGGNVMQYSTV